MTTLLALDTATEACSVAVLHEGQYYHRYAVIPRLHAQTILPMVSEVLAEAGITLDEIDAVVFGQGPGAFTGVRIATGVIQGLAFGLNKPVISISNLAAIAQRAWHEYQKTHIAVAIDARMDEVYWGCYQIDKDIAHLVNVEQVLTPEKVQLPNLGIQWYGVGTGFKYIERMPIESVVLDDNLLPDARDLLTLAMPKWFSGEVNDVGSIEPIYLRNNVAFPKKS